LCRAYHSQNLIQENELECQIMRTFKLDALLTRWQNPQMT
jgi:hypothetical protein